ncbi:MAG: hypothetical protein KQI62_05795 [Deltaproteobacteria bacterium]|nr:hypothetical protein [Deltaproteobacteria bacterium]
MLFEDLVVLGYEGGYDSVWRCINQWRDEHKRLAAPDLFHSRTGPARAFHFDWKEDHAEMTVARVTVIGWRLRTRAGRS